MENAKEDGYNSENNSGINERNIYIAKNLLSINMSLEDISK